MNRTGSREVCAAGVLWGTIGPFIQILGRAGATAAQISFYRVALACVLLAVPLLCRHGLRALRIDRRTLGYCVLLGVCCQGVYNIVYSYAVLLTGVSVSAVLMNTAPVFTAMFAHVLFHEHITRRKWLALAVNILGCSLTATGGHLSGAAISIAGIGCGLASGFCYGMTAVIGRLAGDRTDAATMSVYSYGAAALFLLLWMGIRGESFAVSAPVLGWSALFALLPTVIAYLLYYHGIQKIRDSSRVPVLASIECVVAVGIGVLALHEAFNAVKILGIALVLGSVLLMNPGTSKTACS